METEFETKEVVLSFGKCKVRGYTSMDIRKSVIKVSRINAEFNDKIAELKSKGKTTKGAEDLINDQRDEKLAMLLFDKIASLIVEHDFKTMVKMPTFLSMQKDSEISKITAAIEELSSLKEEEKQDFLPESKQEDSSEVKIHG